MKEKVDKTAIKKFGTIISFSLPDNKTAKKPDV